jgi:hypothetical protein
MSIYSWSSELSKIYVWSNEVSAVYVGTQQVYPAGWKPWANTIAYYTFNNTLNDSSWNNRNLTWTWSFVDGWPWKVYQVTNAYCDDNAFNIYWTNPFTKCVWVRITQMPSSWSNTIMWVQAPNNWAVHNSDINIQNSQKIYCNMWDWDNNDHFIWSGTLSINTRYNVIFSFTWTQMRLYINNVLVDSYNWGSARSLSTTRLVFRRQASNQWNAQFQVSNAVYENVWWGENEVGLFYNSTKSNYGL